jgi:CRISPR system Cascade subunit CasE
MYLSRLIPNVRSAEARRDLADAYELHRTLMRAFPDKDHGGPGRVLFRVDVERDTQQAIVLVQSDKTPDWALLPDAYTTRPSECKAISLAFESGQRLRFRLRANPVVKRKVEGSAEGKRRGLVREADQLAWLGRKGSEGGFGVESAMAVAEGFGASRRGKNGSATHLAVRFDGLLTVTDPAAFLQLLAKGVGPAKGFGFGLLSVAPPP